MKNTHKTLLFVAAICLVAGNTESFGQRRFGGGGGKQSFSSRSFRSGSSFRMHSSVSSKNISSGRSNSVSSTGRRFGSSFNSSRQHQMSSPKSTIKSFSNIKSGVLNKRLTISNGLSGRLSKTQPTKENTLKNPLSKLPNGITSRIPGMASNIKKNAGNGNAAKISTHRNWKDLAKNIVKTSLHRHHWCHTRPNTCLWWNAYCTPIAHCHHHQVVVCDWSRVRCGTVALPTHKVQWHLGLKGILLPGKGLGIDTVEPGSPAEMVGLKPGMVITVCNGIQLVDESSMQEAIRTSGGILRMTLLSADGSQILEGTVQMARVASVSF